MPSTPPEQDLLVWLPRLRRYARALLREAGDADDLVQDTLERAWSRAALWQGVSDMRGWLFSIMHNLHVDALRRQRPETVSLDGDTPEPPTPARDSLLIRDLDAALAALPAEQREVLLLVAVEGMSYAEVALNLGLPIGTVMSRLSRARERVRRHMAGEQASLLKAVK